MSYDLSETLKMVVLKNGENGESDTLFREGRLFQEPIFNLTKAEKK